ncbi:EPCR protein, partial [Pomatorhinus ruficollis]|nr:EPCR protein [Pomatorhinus ruficollis]
CPTSPAAPLAFTMLQLTRVYMGNSMFRGNASLNGQLSHVLEENNVTQVLPLEPPDAWARRQEVVISYLKTFRQLVQLFNKERPTKCEWYPGDRGGCPGKGSLFCTARARGWLSRDRRSERWGHGHRRWPGDLPVATFAQEQLMKYPITTQDLQYFLNTTCVSILQTQSARTGLWWGWGWGQGHGGVALLSPLSLSPLPGKVSGRSRTPLVLGLVLGSLVLLGMALGIFLCTGGSC